MKKFLVSEFITPKEAEEIIRECSNERDKLILQVMWETGGRISEVLSLIPDYIDQVNNCIHLPTMKQKTATGIHPLRRIYLFPESTLCSKLLVYIKEQKIGRYNWIFRGKVMKVGREGQVSTTYVWYLLSGVRRESDRWKRKDGLATKIGIRKMKGEKLKPAWPHLFRHGAAMNIYHRTGKLDVTQKQLGHSSIVTTESYAEMTDDDRKKIIQSCGRENPSL